MAESPPTVEPHVEQPGPAEFRDPLLREELRRASVWIGLALVVAGVIFLAQPLLLILGGLVFGVVLDGGARALGRFLPIGRGWRLSLAILIGIGFVAWVFYYAGTTFAAQAGALRMVVETQALKLYAWAQNAGLITDPTPGTIGQQLMGSVGRLTTAVGSALGALTSALLIFVIGIFIAIEPRLYDRGVAWMLPLRHRDHFYRITNRVGFTLRRLLFGRIVGMIFEGLFTWFMLAWVSRLIGIGPIPMAALLGLITGILAFIPNIGAIVSGLLMVAVGFSAGPNEGFFAIFVYFAVQNIDGYLVLPYIARRTVDLAPAIVLAAQLILGALFGFLGLLLADSILASLKVTLQELSKERSAEKGEGPELVGGNPAA
ncbi:AI-2E family transporter [Sphingomonas piscis]|uniref:AI-2E family transporter n=1 Tax=Sphingomonas piscis TaxID=2714943 RepID=A0A6G7YQ61_9SPHN|nr:AI-2E family transporter [Sphingomonas piscis]QIK78880.1 AI-2E family transporter [Sphingomonas piscis]